MRAILFASATRTSIGGLRSGIRASQVPGRAAAWQCRLMMTLLAPMISSRRKERSPIFVVAPGRCFPPVELRERCGKDRQGGPRRCRKVRLLVLQYRDQAPDIRRALGHDPAVFAQMSAEGIDRLGALPDQQFPHAEDARCPLRFLALHRSKAHARLLGRLANRLRVGRIIFLPLHLSSGAHNAEEPAQTCCLPAFSPHIPPHYFRAYRARRAGSHPISMTADELPLPED